MPSCVVTIIPTKDEALHVNRCVRSALPLGPVVVVDGGSTDKTIEIARRAGASVLEREWDSYSRQKNWALDQVGDKAPWTLFLDADEYLTEDGRQAVRDEIESERGDGYFVARRYFVLGRELRHAYWYPDYQLRLFRSGRGRFEDRLVHEHLVVDGTVVETKIDLMHENLKGFTDYVAKLNRYAELEAREILRPTADQTAGSMRGSWAQRRRALKRVWLRVPGRAPIRFFWLYVVKRGFLDGRAGLVFCGLIAVHDFLIEAKVVERRLGYAPEDVRLRLLDLADEITPESAPGTDR